MKNNREEVEETLSSYGVYTDQLSLLLYLMGEEIE